MPFFDIFASPRWSPLRMRTKVASFFIFFQELSNKKKIKALRPKMTKIASRGGGSCLKSRKKDVTAPENYRGISLTPPVSKVLQRIVFVEVSAFLSNRKLLSKFQFGFRASQSCSDLFLATLDDWRQARDKKRYTTAVFIDRSKAFDNVLHEHLLLTLQACGISGTALRWFRNFLFDRQQRVVVNILHFTFTYLFIQDCRKSS